MLVADCVSLPNAMTDQIDQRRIEYAVSRNGIQAVIFEKCLGGSMEWWRKVFPEIAKTTTVFAYNRWDVEPKYKYEAATCPHGAS